VPTLSVVVPVYNEGASIVATNTRLASALDGLDLSYEIIYVNDGSADDSLDLLQVLSAGDKRLQVLDLSRNFGKEIALAAGLHASVGDAVLMIDADGQHPPERIADFVAAWRAGAEVVVGVREGGEGQSLSKRATSWAYYKVLNSIAERKVVPGSTDFRLIDRTVADAYNTLTERNRITRGLIDWLGFRRSYVYFVADARAQGSASYSPRKLVRLALDSFVSTSLLPLKFAGYLGVFITMVAAVAAVIIGFDKYVFNDPLNGNFTPTGILAVLIVFLVGIILSCLGLIALYIANIHTEVINRPLYVTRPAPGERGE
jgi:dolichol-phosphate mannosyltransferase